MDPVAEEQQFLDRAYERLTLVRADLDRRLRAVLSAPGTGTAQDRLERQALADLLGQQIAAARIAERRLCFGRIDDGSAAPLHLGRIGLRDDQGDPLMLDWRAPQAAAFYQATSAAPMGLRHRRRIFTRDRLVTQVEDEDLANPLPLTEDVDHRAAATAAARERSGRMADIVATIAADQDRIVRAPLNRVTVVEGGPGTGKTVVALHRAAWLLYTYRDQLARDGVLVVGPSNVFCRYIEQVLPSLGETDVVLLTVGELHPGVHATAVDEPHTALVKGDPAMAEVIANAVAQRIRLPHGGLRISLADGSHARVSASRLEQARASVPRRATFHAGREPFLRRVLDDLARDRAEARGEDPADPDIRATHLADLVDDPNVRRALNLMWLPTTPERVISSLLTDAAVLAAAASGVLDAGRQAALLREPGSPWTVDDVPLLDEAAELLGDFSPPAARAPAPEEGYAELDLTDSRAVVRDPLAERAARDRSWVYGHVVVDEAQELSRMAWRALARRCSRRSMTVVGDLQQAAHPAAARTWDQVLSWARDRVDLHTLTVTYRITRQTARTATDQLLLAGGTAPHLRPIRDGDPTRIVRVQLRNLASVIERLRGAGRAAVIVADDQIGDLYAAWRRWDSFAFGDEALDAPVAVLDARQAKGLEFDHVFVIDPDRLRRQGHHGGDVYVACTRATRTLHLVTLTESETAPETAPEVAPSRSTR